MSERVPLEDASPPGQPVLEAARAHERDRYLSALLAPADAQGDLIVLAAYFGEVARIPLVVQDAAIGEIRLQWWRDALAPSSEGSGHPVADALLDLRRRRSLAHDLLVAPLEGFSRALYEDGIRDASELQQYAEETDGAAIRLALAVLDGKSQVAGPPAEAAARALALTRLALTLPQQLAHGRLPLPVAYIGAARDPRGLAAQEARDATRHLLQRLAAEATDALTQFRAGQDRLSPGLLTAFLPVCLVAPYLKSIVAASRDVLVDVADISPLSRVARLWFAHWRGRI